MYTEKEGLAFVWQDTSNGARILRVYSGMPSVRIPEELNGRKVVSVGAYCFSGINRAGNYIGTDMPAASNLFEFCGNNVESVILPDTLEIIEDNAFYNCHKLVLLEAGAALRETGSGLFMNCTCFTKLYLRQKADMPGGLKQIVSRISSHLDVYFYDKELISNEKKLNNVVRAVVTSLEKKGFVVSENDVKNIIAGIEKIVTDLRLNQINS